MLLSILYIIGITAEAITGALAAGREKMDIFGVVIIASMTAIGGGSVRDVLLGHYPLGWVKHPEYFIIVASAAVLTVFIAPFIRHFMRYTPFSWYWMPLGLSCFPLLVPKSR